MRKRLMKVSLLTPLLLALLFVTADNAFGQIDPSVLYKIIAKHSDRCLDVSGGPGAIANGARVIQWDCIGGDNQKWRIIPTEHGYYQIIAKHSNKCLDVFGGVSSTGNGVIVEQWDCNDAANQRWWFWPIGNGYYKIQARHSSRYLDIRGGPGAISNNIGAQQLQFTDLSNQAFRLEVAPQ